MHLKYSSEREALAALLAPQIVDAENAVCHLLPFIAGENHCVRQRILDTVTSCS
ncbi:hypothetical protein GBAR_LOCUS24701 [Geodia barretti]|uniref:Uncharacterized protein n=1 Tax=Geodia barretti TaxID=519541 RepID=A0AA35XBE1_GEOBA|nr:hypothetical protein GBAR_LOCUS24701 [Geodia barretti]